MLFKSTLLTAALLAVAGIDARSLDHHNQARQSGPTVYLAGDSTMANTPSPHQGWGQYLAKYITLPVVNKAISGRSARSYWNEGRFTELVSLVKSGDIVVIEFGHNDGGSPNGANDNGRSDCPGTGPEVCTSGKTGEKVYTFNYYVENASRNLINKGAKVIVSSQTPNNMWEYGTWNPAPSRFVAYAATAGRNLAGAGLAASFVDHFQACAGMYARLGNQKTNSLFPVDHTHTSPEGADLVAQAFVQAVSRDYNGTTPLRGYLRSPVPVVF